MSKSSRRVTPGAMVLWIALVPLIGCETPQPRPPPPVTQTQPQSEQPPPTEQRRSQSETATPEAAGQQPSESPAEPASPQYLPPSADGAEVRVTETPVGAASRAGAAEPAADGASPASSAQRSVTGRPDAGDEARPQTDGRAREPAGSRASPDPDQVGPAMNIGGARTAEERAALLQRKLDSGLSGFDGMLLQERALLEQQRERAAGGGAPAGAEDGRGGRAEMPPEERGAGGAATIGTGEGNTPDLVGETRRGDVRNVSTGPVPEDIRNTRDDDIVARQLREAATNERDPALREKLWEEYRKYTRGLKSR